MDASLNSLTDAPERNVADDVPPETAIGSTCHRDVAVTLSPPRIASSSLRLPSIGPRRSSPFRNGDGRS